MNRTAKTISVALLLAIGWSGPAWAFHFVPTEAQWNSWSPLCKARYSVSSAADGSPYARSIDASEVQRWQAVTGQYVWNNIHHYCAGIAWHFSARTEIDPEQRAKLLASATKEVDYTYRKVQPGMPMYSTVAIALASIWLDRGEANRAAGYIDAVISAQPEDPSGYVALSTVYQRQKKWAEARNALLTGEKATSGTSAEIAYQLGLVSLQMGDKDAAVQFARKAYGMGYPLPGLRRRLQEAGVQL
jgi:tetratricopeptide (TPR) repeat protein